MKLDAAGRRILFDEVSLYIPGGSTADADALQLATNILKDQPEDSSRWVIMVTGVEGNVNTRERHLSSFRRKRSMRR